MPFPIKAINQVKILTRKLELCRVRISFNGPHFRARLQLCEHFTRQTSIMRVHHHHDRHA